MPSENSAINLMEVCGTHTMAIATAGIKQILPDNIKLLSGPGCPVCVTPAGDIDLVLALSAQKDVIITSYGDMLRVPGTARGDNLNRRKALGADVRLVYSPLDALRIAKENPSKEVVFVGIGFETTAPGTAVAIMKAAEDGTENLSVFSTLKMVEPALRTLIADPEFNVQGFICPGHVATIIGEDGFRFLPQEYGLPAVISGFEAEDIILTVRSLVRQIREGRAELENRYKRAVAEHGNTEAMEFVNECFEPIGARWRGLGYIEDSGLGIRRDYRDFDALERFGMEPSDDEEETACRCGDVIQGKLDPRECPLFGKACIPEEPVGPCMVSSEGACAAAYKYGRE